MQQDTNGIRPQQLALKTKGKKEGKNSMETVKEAILDVMRDRGFRVGYSLSGKSLYHQVRPKLNAKEQDLIEAALLQLAEEGILTAPPDFALTEAGFDYLYGPGK